VVAGLGPDLVTVKKATRVATGRKEVPDMALGKEEKNKEEREKGRCRLGKKKKGKKEKEGDKSREERKRERKRKKRKGEREMLTLRSVRFSVIEFVRPFARPIYSLF
jgi:hypothetical protein